ncbi:MAG: SDR family oxidoreductase [Proteobacteria bacterium]|nr:SDR family oxidoreductase [Pseudomonadota bacterium]MBU1389465.1 SDR family oxidoreductase [Pseudomonadota bacterium]MBU1541285.1 SDR family oxidoreductase [Pseudomonadota bacterium]MBU2430156.1 SDR family oxidoreductase [Pseudomonadota bacterium]
MKKILIIGAQGYLGSRLSDYLLKRGYLCTGLDTGFFKNGVLFEPHPIEIIKKDARTIEPKDLKGFDIVLMLAGISNDPFGNLKADVIYDPTFDYAIKIARFCKQQGIRYIFPSSCSVYGIGQGQLDENSEVNPQTHYSINKVQIEQALIKISDKNFSPIALRLATVFGISPRMRFDIVINMLCGLALTENKIILNSNGEAWRPHLHIEDVCEAFRCCIDWDYQDGALMVLNVGRNDNNWKIIDIAKIIQKQISGCELEFLHETNSNLKNDLVKDRKIQDGVDTRTYQVSFDKINEILPGFEAKWHVEQGIIDLLDNLKHWNVNDAKFKQRDFYRLQQLEFLHQTKQISDDLFWTI